jgi:hypothetical protein
MTDIEQGIGGGGLLKIAEKITMEHNLYSIDVISGEGVKGYYETKKYYEEDTFIIKNFNFWTVWFLILVKYFRDLFNILKGVKFTTKSKDV